MKILSKKFGNRGVTLVEVLIYIFLLVLLVVFSTVTIISMIRTVAEVRISRAINNSAVIALERMTRDIREANIIDLDSSEFGVNPGTLVVIANDGSNATTTTFAVNATNTLIMQVDSNDPEPLTAFDLYINNLTFRHISVTNSDAIKIELEIRNRNGQVIRSKTYYTTVVMRGFYD